MRCEVSTVSSDMLKKSLTGTRGVLVAIVFAVNLVLPAAQAQSQQAKDKAAVTTGKAPVTAAPVRYKPDRFAGRAWKYYQLIWGIDSLTVRLVESGEVVRFSYRVVDADKARALNDKKSEPSLIDPRAGVSLVVPRMEKI